MESHLGVLPLQHLECKCILREKERVKVWQVDLLSFEKQRERSVVAVGEKSNYDEELLRSEQNWNLREENRDDFYFLHHRKSE